MFHEKSFEIQCSLSFQLKRLKMENLDCVNNVIVFCFTRATKNRISPFMGDLDAKNSKLKNSLLIVLWEMSQKMPLKGKLCLLVHFPCYLIHMLLVIRQHAYFIFIIIIMFWHLKQLGLLMTKIHDNLTTTVSARRL